MEYSLVMQTFHMLKNKTNYVDDKIEDEKHILSECNLSPIRKINLILMKWYLVMILKKNHNFPNFMSSCYKYKNILAKSGHRL